MFGTRVVVCLGRILPVEDAAQVQLRGDDRAAFGAFVGADDAFAFQGIDDTARPRVADPEAPLDRAYGG